VNTVEIPVNRIAQFLFDLLKKSADHSVVASLGVGLGRKKAWQSAGQNFKRTFCESGYATDKLTG